jgi:hypothetical protein
VQFAAVVDHFVMSDWQGTAAYGSSGIPKAARQLSDRACFLQNRNRFLFCKKRRIDCVLVK